MLTNHNTLIVKEKFLMALSFFLGYLNMPKFDPFDYAEINNAKLWV